MARKDATGRKFESALEDLAQVVELWIHHLRTGGTEVVGLGKGSIDEPRIEDYIVSDLVDFDDVAYDSHADLLYDLISAGKNCLRRIHLKRIIWENEG